jgi:hypothetical protein
MAGRQVISGLRREWQLDCAVRAAAGRRSRPWLGRHARRPALLRRVVAGLSGGCQHGHCSHVASARPDHRRPGRTPRCARRGRAAHPHIRAIVAAGRAPATAPPGQPPEQQPHNYKASNSSVGAERGWRVAARIWPSVCSITVETPARYLHGGRADYHRWMLRATLWLIQRPVDGFPPPQRELRCPAQGRDDKGAWSLAWRGRRWGDRSRARDAPAFWSSRC